MASRRYARPRALKPDVVLMDIRMPVMHGLEAAKVILDGGQVPPPRILIVTTFDEDEHVFEALRSGASGFVLKDTPPEQLLDAIRVVAGRRRAADAEHYPAPDRRVRPQATGCAGRGRGTGQLTDRELEVLGQVAAGLSNAEIAAHLS